MIDRVIGRRGALALLAAGLLGGCRAAPAEAGRGLVTLDGGTARLALLLRREQAGTVAVTGGDPVLPAIAAVQGAPVLDLGGAGGLDLEALARLRPEVLAGHRLPGVPAELLRGLARLRLVRRTGDVRADALALGAAVGAAGAAVAAWEAFERDRAELAARLAARRMPTISVLGAGRGDGVVTTVSGSTAAGQVLRALGVARPAAQEAVADGPLPFPEISGERLGEHDADLLVLLRGNAGSVREQPLLRTSPAVRAGRVVEADQFEWAALASLPSARWVLADLAGLLLERSAPLLGIGSPGGLDRLRGFRAG
ncbi:ABC transporter substrate-binding protein [Saccharopolyspora gregorii]|uniref:ABC transporter substrate-binding protein n=1 Tax=Saccharopolyspora gregorii TaxID=33914 RepID=A0ABP6RLY6_9PSEU